MSKTNFITTPASPTTISSTSNPTVHTTNQHLSPPPRHDTYAPPHHQHSNDLKGLVLEQLDPTNLTRHLIERSHRNVSYTKLGTRRMVQLDHHQLTPPQEEEEDGLPPPGTKLSNKPLSSSDHDHHSLYQFTERLLFHLKRGGINQSLILRGDTGSGKSRTCQWILRCLGELRSNVESPSTKEGRWYQQVYRVDTIWQAFGNVATGHHQQASRLGRYWRFQFDHRGRTVGVHIQALLEETTRVIRVPPGESHFHIFHQLLAGLPLKERHQLHLTEPYHYRYLQEAATPFHPTTLESQFQTLQRHLKTLGFPRPLQSEIWQVLAAILHLGNLNFTDTNLTDPCLVRNPEVMALAARQLGLLPTTFEELLTHRTSIIRKERCTVILSAEEARRRRDELVTCLYRKLFNWLITRLNHQLHSNRPPSPPSHHQDGVISILDLPGFQAHLDLPSNSLATFLINYAHERIYHYTSFQIFEAQNHHYREDGILLPPVPYRSNQPLLHLLTDPTTGLMARLHHLTTAFAKSPHSLTSLVDDGDHDPHLLHRDPQQSQFTLIHHHGAPVTYNSSEFVELNYYEVTEYDFMLTFQTESEDRDGRGWTGNPFVSELFAVEAGSEDDLISGPSSSPIPPSYDDLMGRSEPHPRATGDGLVFLPGGHARTLHLTLDRLFDTLDPTQLWWLFCLKPNPSPTHSSSHRWDFELVHQQVERYDLASIVRMGEELTVGYRYDEFLTRYEGVMEELMRGLSPHSSQRGLLTAIKLEWGGTNGGEGMVIGKEYVYLTDPIWWELESKLTSIMIDRKLTTPSRTLSITHHHSSRGRNPIDDGNLVDTDDESEVLGSWDPHLHREAVLNPKLLSFDTRVNGYDMVDDMEEGEEEEEEEEEMVTRSRRYWVCCTWIITWWIPNFCLRYGGGMRGREVRMAWREKVTLCFLIFLLCTGVVMLIVGINPILCPTRQIYSTSEVRDHRSPSQPWASINGRIFDLKKLATHYGTTQYQLTKLYAGKDLSSLFPLQLSSLCQRYDGTKVDESISLSNTSMVASDKNGLFHDHRYYRGDGYYHPNWYQNTMRRMILTMKVGDLAVDDVTLRNRASEGYYWFKLDNKIYDLNDYVIGNLFTLRPPSRNGNQTTATPNSNFMDPRFIDLVRMGSGKDITTAFHQLYRKDPTTKEFTLECLHNVFYKGVGDDRQSLRCLVAQYSLLLCSIFLFLVLVVKFLASLRLGTRPEPEDHHQFVICNIPCYTEGEESLQTTIDSLTISKYDDKRKLLFIVADGMVMGGGNELPTPHIVAKILRVDPRADPAPLSFYGLGEGTQIYNRGRVYSGLYQCKDHTVPYLFIVKVGQPNERHKPGNRGKRDSQLILMRFFNRVHYDHPMVPLELELYYQMKNVIGVDPIHYEFILMIDADTVVMPDAINRLVSVMRYDSKIMGICGETSLRNERDSWATMIQVYEYYISHHLAKAFESLFGSVTCLPGCFSMYRIKSLTTNQALLVHNKVLLDYSMNQVDTLHLKNLLHLGEDRYLSTLMLKHFPRNKLTFTADAKCLTAAPDTWKILLSQRRRWINSTVHNLVELISLPRLCGILCCSMRFVVMMDLISTIIMPATLTYLGYLIYRLSVDNTSIPLISLMFLIAPYLLQMLVFILHRQWQHMGWMVVHLVALPIFAFFIPLYAFWHFDDFSWGHTRLVMEDPTRRRTKNRKNRVSKLEPILALPPIPTQRWSDYEQERWEYQSCPSTLLGNLDKEGELPLNLPYHLTRSNTTLSSFITNTVTPFTITPSSFSNATTHLHLPPPPKPLTPHNLPPLTTTPLGLYPFTRLLYPQILSQPLPHPPHQPSPLTKGLHTISPSSTLPSLFSGSSTHSHHHPYPSHHLPPSTCTHFLACHLRSPTLPSLICSHSAHSHHPPYYP